MNMSNTPIDREEMMKVELELCDFNVTIAKRGFVLVPRLKRTMAKLEATFEVMPIREDAIDDFVDEQFRKKEKIIKSFNGEI